MQYADYRNGNEKVNTVRKVQNTFTVEDVTLKRGLVGSSDLFDWLKDVREGTIDPRSVTISLLDEARKPVSTWKLRQAQPKKWTGPDPRGQGRHRGGDGGAHPLPRGHRVQLMALAVARRPLGAPGISIRSPEPVRTLTGVRRDIAAFVGVAPRGPVRLPSTDLDPDTDVASHLVNAPVRRSIAVPVTSWDEYRLHFGGFEGPGRLPYAVSAFFAGGGTSAYVVRVVHDYGDALSDAGGRASGQLTGLTTIGSDPLVLYARSEGSWGNHLRATLSFQTRPVPTIAPPTPGEVVVDRSEWVPVGSLLRLDLGGDVSELRYVDDSREEPDPSGPGRQRHLRLASASSSAAVAVELVTATLEIVDHDPGYPRHEQVAGLGLHPDHPRWLARALVAEAALVWPDASWAADALDLAGIDPALPSVPLIGGTGSDEDSLHMAGGVDRWADIEPSDFYDPSWIPGNELPASGVHCLAEHDDVGLLVVPDLYEPEPIAPMDDVEEPASLCGPEFGPHVPTPPTPPHQPPPPGLDGLALDPRVPGELADIVAHQAQLVAFAEARREFTLLLDVPLGLPQRQILQWRNTIDSPYAAAYHPWLDVAAPLDNREALVRVNPSAFAAAVIAERENRLGVQHGPANQVAVGAVRVADTVTPAQHDALHPAGINVFLPERDGIRLTGARTLSRRPSLRQLNVVRLMTVLRLTLQREMTWAVFEPNGPDLWAEVRRMIHALLTRLYEAGAFRGATTKEAFFVRADRTTMSRNDLDSGRFVCLVGVAPAEPVEYLVLEIARERDTSVQVEMAPQQTDVPAV